MNLTQEREVPREKKNQEKVEKKNRTREKKKSSARKKNRAREKKIEREKKKSSARKKKSSARKKKSSARKKKSNANFARHKLGSVKVQRFFVVSVPQRNQPLTKLFAQRANYSLV